MPLCSYGCGQEAIHQFGNEKWCCNKNIASCPEIIRRSNETRKGQIPWNKNKKTGPESEDTKKKKSKSHIGKTGYWKGKKQSKESRRRAVEKMAGRTKENHEGIRSMSEKITGLNHPRWNPDREQVFAPYTEEFYINTSKVRERDGYICQLCFKPGRTVHHIDENKQDSRMENLVNLCSKCHTKIHTKDKGIWIIFCQPYFRCVVNEFQNIILFKE